MVTGNSNNENSFFSELTINENQSFVSEQLREDDMVANIKQTSQRDYNNSESFISDQSTDPDMEAQPYKLRRKEYKRKRIQKLIFWRTIAVIKGLMIMNSLMRKWMT